MLETIRRVLGYQLTIAQLIALGVVVGTPYLLIGAIWSTTHTAHLQNMHGVDLVVSFLGSIVSWPVLLFANVCITGQQGQLDYRRCADSHISAHGVTRKETREQSSGTTRSRGRRVDRHRTAGAVVSGAPGPIRPMGNADQLREGLQREPVADPRSPRRQPPRPVRDSAAAAPPLGYPGRHHRLGAGDGRRRDMGAYSGRFGGKHPILGVAETRPMPQPLALDSPDCTVWTV